MSGTLKAQGTKGLSTTNLKGHGGVRHGENLVERGECLLYAIGDENIVGGFAGESE